MRIPLALLIVACITISCASTEVTSHKRYALGEKLQKHNRIIVYNFGATPDDIPADAAISGYYRKRAKPQTAGQIRLGRVLAHILAKELVEEIRKMGMPAEYAGIGPAPGIGDLLIKGEFVTIEEGSKSKRLLIGFGAGAGKLMTHVVRYQITAEGPRLLGRKVITAKDGKMPGLLLPVTAGAATGNVVAPVIFGGLIIRREIVPENLHAGAIQTAQEIAKVLSKEFVEQGWIQADRAK